MPIYEQEPPDAPIEFEHTENRQSIPNDPPESSHEIFKEDIVEDQELTTQIEIPETQILDHSEEKKSTNNIMGFWAIPLPKADASSSTVSYTQKPNK